MKKGLSLRDVALYMLGLLSCYGPTSLRRDDKSDMVSTLALILGL